MCGWTICEWTHGCAEMLCFLQPMSIRVDEMLGADAGEDDSDEDGSDTAKKDKAGGKPKKPKSPQSPKAVSGGASPGDEAAVDSNKYHMDVVESNQSTLAMDSKRMKTDFVSYVDKTAKTREKQATGELDLDLQTIQVASDKELRAGYILTETVLGEGSFGKVYLARRRHKTTTEGCDASVEPSQVGGGDNEGHLAAKVLQCKSFDNIGAELLSLKACQGSPNVVGLDGAGVYRMDPGNRVVIMTELCTKELYDVVVAEAPLPQDKSHHFFKGLIEGIRHVHACGYCHRDIKLENILLLGEVVKICDFGFAAPHSQPDGTPITMNRQCGSLVYASPQSYRGEDYHGCAADVWSCGVVLYVMLFGEFPFGRPDSRHCKRYRLHERNQSVFGHLEGDLGLVELLAGMLRIQVDERWSVAQVMEHPWTHKGPASPADVKESVSDAADSPHEVKGQNGAVERAQGNYHEGSTTKPVTGSDQVSVSFGATTVAAAKPHSEPGSSRSGQNVEAAGGGHKCLIM